MASVRATWRRWIATTVLAAALPASAWADDTRPGAANWREFDHNLAQLAETTSALAAEIVDGGCRPLHAMDPDRVMAIASSFKLYVLGAFGNLVAQGSASWGETISIREDLISVPHGDLRWSPPGTAFTARYIAERMIQVSDNTATDHLIARVGRETIEHRMAVMGHADPSLNTPLLTVREMALLKLALPTEVVDRYAAAPVTERRRILADDVAPLGLDVLDDVPDPRAPVEIDRVEWFASRSDMCRAMAALHVMSGQPGLLPIREILTLETQIPFDGEIWPYVGFKGGSELGVLHGTWLMQRRDGRLFVFSVGLNDTAKGIDVNGAIGVLTDGVTLIAAAP